MRLHLPRRANAAIVGLTVVVCSTSFATVVAQPQAADPQAYQEAKRAATSVFLDPQQPKEKRLAAVQDLGYPDTKTFAALLAIGADRTQDDDIRWEALRRHRYNEEYQKVVLRILDDPTDGGEDLDAHLVEDLSRKAIRPTQEVRQQTQAVFRKLLKDPRDKVRRIAYVVSVGNHDPVAVGQLAQSMRDPEAPRSLSLEAIELLDLDGSVNHVVTLRPFLDDPNPKVQAVAARALSVDPQSRRRIVALVKDPKAPVEVRTQALRGLARQDDRFSDYAIPLVENNQEVAAVRQAALKAFVGRMNSQRVQQDVQVRFAQAVERLATNESPATDEDIKVREAARALFPYLKSAFPEVKKHYER